MTLIKDLITIPEQVRKGDFVLKLTEGVLDPTETLRNYVVTEQLVSCFDDALGLIRDSMQGPSGKPTSKATYLHGSFGSGKSHFMAVLHLLLQGNAEARSVKELASVVAKHDSWMKGKRFLLVPYHMIGAKSLESRVLGGYAEHVRRESPEAPVPGVYLAESLFADASKDRTAYGDEAFFGRLNEGAEGSDGEWGELEAEWTPERYDAAQVAAPNSEERSRLVGQLVKTMFTSYANVAAGGTEAFVSMDDGLAVISRHAQELRYDAVVLFLDELVLWLATRATERSFVNEEGAKVSKLVESENPRRPIPIVSFVARQRALKELVGKHLTGAEELQSDDVLEWWDARFGQISLEDRNLPEIASKRVLRPKSESAKQQLDQAFAETQKVREEVRQVLLTRDGDPEMFRKVYPFSPALVQALVAASGALQRERTALKVMLQLLVDQRDRLELGELVPVGDLFDVLAEGEEPFTEQMKRQFDNAKKLYHQKLLPLLESDHGLTREAVREAAPDDLKARAFRTDDRLLKTLLLAALVPEVEALHGLTPLKLAALNHGTIRTPVPGREAQEVLRRCKGWAAQVGELKISADATNPLISLQLSGVDTDGILANALGEDNMGNRRRKVKELLYEQLGIGVQDGLFVEHVYTWSGTKRRFEVIFGNVRELPDDSLATKDDQMKVVIDFPFDPEQAAAGDDLTRLDQFREGGRSARTLAWLPCFFTQQLQSDLGKLVRLDHVLTDEGFRRCASHLSAVDQAMGRPLLENQRAQLRQRIVNALEGAYGVAKAPDGAVEETFEPSEQFQSLDPGFAPRPPVAANLAKGFEDLLSQFLRSTFPGHPTFGTDLTPGKLKKTAEQVVLALQETDGRLFVDQPQRALLRDIAQPLMLGTMHETHFVCSRHWLEHLDRQLALEPGVLSVERARGWFDVPKVMGLPRDVEDLALIAFAVQSNRSFYLHGSPIEPEIGRLHDATELREHVLPPEEDWKRAIEVAGKVFGLALSQLASAASVSTLTAKVREIGQSDRPRVEDLVGEVQAAAARRKLDENGLDRLTTARAVQALVNVLHAAKDEVVVATLVAADVATSLDAMGRSFRSAEDISHLLRDADWHLFEAVGRLEDDRKPAAQAIADELTKAIAHDELAVGLSEALKGLQRRAVDLLADVGTPPPPPPPPPTPPGVTLIERDERTSLEPADAAAVLRELSEKMGENERRRLDLSWVVREEPES